MSHAQVSRADAGIVVFHFFPNLAYGSRVLAAFALIAVGLVTQAAMVALFPGILLVLAGNALLLVRGYNNMVDLGTFHADADWQKIDCKKLSELQNFVSKMKSWDSSWLDVSSPLGWVFFLPLLVMFLVCFAGAKSDAQFFILAGNIAVLLLPHWLTGIRRVLTRPDLMLKVDLIKNLYEEWASEIAPDKIFIEMLFLEKEKFRIPKDVRIKVRPQNVRPEFLGLQGQVAINAVQGHSYVYFYVVLIARPGAGLRQLQADMPPLDGTIVSEFKHTGEAEVLVIRQRTSQSSGYHTDKRTVQAIFKLGWELARKF